MCWGTGLVFTSCSGFRRNPAYPGLRWVACVWALVLPEARSSGLGSVAGVFGYGVSSGFRHFCLGPVAFAFGYGFPA